MKVRHKLRETIDSLYSCGIASYEAYTHLVLECVRANDVDQAKRLQSHMFLQVTQTDYTSLQNRILHLYTKTGKISDARKLFDKMPRRDVFSWNTMLSACAKSGSVEDLRGVFNQMGFRDLVSYNTLIAGLAGNGCSGEALRVFVRMQEEGFEPTEYALVGALHACSQLLDLRRGKQIHGRIVSVNLGGNVFVWNALTDMYAKCGEIDMARWLFDRMDHKNVVSWNLMICGYMKNGQPEKCIDLYQKLRLSGSKPDQVTVSNVIGAYFHSGYIDEATKVFTEFKEKDKFCYTAMIVGFSQNGKEEDAFMLFNQMLLENIRPDSFTISSVVSSCGKIASLFRGQVAHGRAILVGVDDDLLVSSALIDMYCKCGVTADASVVFQTMPNRNVVAWNSMIGGYAQNGRDLEALALYEKLLQENLKPDSVTFVGVLSACSNARLIEQGKKNFDSISNLHGMTPTLDHYVCMVNLLGRSGCIDEAVALINGMPHEPNYRIWSTLLSVCAMKGDMRRGEMVAKCLFQLDAFDAVPYIMLSNMYAACGRWKDVASMRFLMKKKNVRKLAAYSWIEVDNKMHKFVSEDRTHPETDKIYEELSRLIVKLQEAGFTPDINWVLHDVGEEEKFESICYHSEKLALAFGLLRKPLGETPIRIIKNIRVCGDCHVFMKFVSKTIGRVIILRDSNKFHHFVGGLCSCKDYW